MWNEPSAGVALQAGPADRPPQPAVVATVAPGSIGEELGFQPGDRLFSVNGVRPRDLIDLQVLVAEEDLLLEVEDPEGSLHRLQIEKDADEGLGLGFTEALFDGLRQCNNHCAFCFIDQQPPGRRRSLYVKDDDYRLSFLYGSYLTLTNLTPADWERIEAQRLSPCLSRSMPPILTCGGACWSIPGRGCSWTSWPGLPSVGCRSMPRWWFVPA